MTYLELTYLHLSTVVPAFFIGTYLLLRAKGAVKHRWWGRIYLALMAATAVVTLFMPAEVGPRIAGHLGYIHLLSLLALVTVPTAYVAARSRNVSLHRRSMLGLYFGGLVLAGSFAFMPGRLLHGWLFGM